MMAQFEVDANDLLCTAKYEYGKEATYFLLCLQQSNAACSAHRYSVHL
jgi:hypothetical protein